MKQSNFSRSNNKWLRNSLIATSLLVLSLEYNVVQYFQKDDLKAKVKTERIAKEHEKDDKLTYFYDLVVLQKKSYTDSVLNSRIESSNLNILKQLDINSVESLDDKTILVHIDPFNLNALDFADVLLYNDMSKLYGEVKVENNFLKNENNQLKVKSYSTLNENLKLKKDVDSLENDLNIVYAGFQNQDTTITNLIRKNKSLDKTLIEYSDSVSHFSNTLNDCIITKDSLENDSSVVIPNYNVKQFIKKNRENLDEIYEQNNLNFFQKWKAKRVNKKMERYLRNNQFVSYI